MAKFLKLVNGRPKMTEETQATYNSGWITVSGINNTPSAGWHRLTTTFTDYPKQCDIIVDNGTNIFPLDPSSKLVFKLISSVYYIDVDLSGGVISTDMFKVTAVNY